MAGTSFQQPVGSSYTALPGGIDVSDLLGGLSTPYSPYEYTDPRGYLTGQQPDPNDVLNQARQAAVGSEAPIPPWETIYNTAVSMREQRLQQELAGIQGSGDAALGQITQLLGHPLPQMPGGPLGEEFGQLYQRAGDFAKAEVPTQVAGAQNKARVASSAVLDQILGNLSSTNYQGQVQQAVNRPGNVMSAFGSFTDLANQRSAAGRAELQAIVDQETADAKSRQDATFKRYDAGVDLTKQGIISGTALGTTQLAQAGADTRAAASQAAAADRTDATIAAADARAKAAQTAAMDRLKAQQQFALTDPKNAALVGKYKAETEAAIAKAKNGGPLTEGDKRRALSNATGLGLMDREFSTWGGGNVNPQAAVTQDDLSKTGEILKSLAAQTMRAEIPGTTGAATARTDALNYINRLAHGFGDSIQVDKHGTKATQAAEREASYRTALANYQSYYNSLSGAGMDPATRARAVAIFQHNTQKPAASRVDSLL